MQATLISKSFNDCAESYIAELQTEVLIIDYEARVSVKMRNIIWYQDYLEWVHFFWGAACIS